MKSNTEKYHATPWKRSDGYQEMLLSDGLGGDEKRLPDDFELGDDNEITTFRIGDAVVRLVLVDYQREINNCGIPFTGDIVATYTDLTAKEMAGINLAKAVEAKLDELFTGQDTQIDVA